MTGGYQPKGEPLGDFRASLRTSLAPSDAITLLPNPDGGHSITLHFPGGYEQAAACYALLMQVVD